MCESGFDIHSTNIIPQDNEHDKFSSLTFCQTVWFLLLQEEYSEPPENEIYYTLLEFNYGSCAMEAMTLGKPYNRKRRLCNVHHICHLFRIAHLRYRLPIKSMFSLWALCCPDASEILDRCSCQ